MGLSLRANCMQLPAVPVKRRMSQDTVVIKPLKVGWRYQRFLKILTLHADVNQRSTQTTENADYDE